MNTRTNCNERKMQLISEYIADNKCAARGKRLVILLLYAIMLVRVLLALFEIPSLVILGAPISILASVLLFPLFFVIKLISNGSKGFAYLLLTVPILRLIIHFSVTAKLFPDTTFATLYSVILLLILLVQFFISMFLLVSFDCDTYFAAVQRISIKVRTEALPREKSEVEEDFSIDKTE